MVISIEPIEIDGKFYVGVTIDGEVRRHGPYDDTNAAEAMARRLMQVGHGLTSSGGRRG